MIDYIITNRTIKPEQILDVRALIFANIGFDHNLVLGKITMSKSLRKHKHQGGSTEKFNIESLKNESTKDLYKRRLAQKFESTPCTEEDTVNTI